MMKSIRKEAVQDTARYFNITSFEELIIENETLEALHNAPSNSG